MEMNKLSATLDKEQLLRMISALPKALEDAKYTLSVELASVDGDPVFEVGENFKETDLDVFVLKSIRFDTTLEVVSFKEETRERAVRAGGVDVDVEGSPFKRPRTEDLGLDAQRILARAFEKVETVSTLDILSALASIENDSQGVSPNLQLMLLESRAIYESYWLKHPPTGDLDQEFMLRTCWFGVNEVFRRLFEQRDASEESVALVKKMREMCELMIAALREKYKL
jgi:hypothetical protein